MKKLKMMKKQEQSKKVIGILGTIAVDEENDKIVALYDGYRNAIIKKGCIPFLITTYNDYDYLNTKRADIPELTEEEKEYYKCVVDMCDGLLIPGGYRWYNFDEFIVGYAIEKDIPVLGICMGMQMLACLDNNDFNEQTLKLNETNIDHSQRNIKYVHKVNIVENTKLYKILNTNSINVNSKHRYHVDKVNNYRISGYSDDGLIEAIEHLNKKFVIGVQWHPEKMIEYDEFANKILDSFVEECNKNNL